MDHSDPHDRPQDERPDRPARRGSGGAEGLLARALGDLEAHPAPPELDRAVEGLIEAAVLERGLSTDVQRAIEALRTLPEQAAPAVLERLVAEELADPAAHQVQRFTDLERLRAPDELSRRLERRLHRRQLVSQLALPLGGAAAAALLAWLSLAGVFTSQKDAPRRSFEVVRLAQSELHPLTQGLIGALGGTPVVPEKPEDAR